jgi:hypothetical protein
VRARLLGLLILASLASAKDVGGEITSDTTWSGTVVMLEDVIVRKGATLTIEPGTHIIPSKEVKGGGGGWHPRSLEIHVHGALYARGTPERRIHFGPEAERKTEVGNPVWFGIIFHPRRTKLSRLYWCRIEHANAGVQATGRELEIMHGLFANCRVGLSAGVLHGEVGRARVDRSDGTAPILRFCLFARCGTAVIAEGSARPDLERTVFLDCDTGVGYRGLARYPQPVRGVGTRLERCEFIRCRRGVEASSRISNCIFDRNSAAIVSSDAHAALAIVIDRYRIDGVLGEGNDALLVGDLPRANGVRIAAVGRSGELPRKEQNEPASIWGPPLEESLALAEDSPGRGMASDGGDMGAFGRGRQKSTVAVSTRSRVAGVPLDSWLICGPIGSAPALDENWPTRKPKLGKAGAGFVWVGVADALGEPRRPGGVLTAGPAKPRFVLAELTAETDCGMRIGIAFDGKLAVWCNGRQSLPRTQVHFAQEKLVDVELEKGTNRIMLWLGPRMERAPFRARVVDKNGDTPDDVACVSQQEKSRGYSIRSAKAERAEGGLYTLVVRFSSPPFWTDAVDPKNYSLTTTAGVAYKLRFRRIEYDPKRSSVIFHACAAPYRDTFLLAVAPIRDSVGVRRAPARPVKVKFR